MAKHNGRARKAGEKVGKAIANRHRNKSNGAGASGLGFFEDRHTTDIGPGKNTQSVLERSDLDELMAMADLADRDFSAQRGEAIVITTGAFDALTIAKDEEVKAEAEARNAHLLSLPRRPAWDASTTPEQLDQQERAAFLDWRRRLAEVEDSERLMLTPFEKNLEVWRQLWRVVERSDIIVQVLDARDPLLYRSGDLEAFARELHVSKRSLLLLNKADLLPANIRKMWADFFDKVGVDYVFWSAFVAGEEQLRLRSEANALGVDFEVYKQAIRDGKPICAPNKSEFGDYADESDEEESESEESEEAEGPADEKEGASSKEVQKAEGTDKAAEEPPVSPAVDDRIRILDADELLDFLEGKARAAVESAGKDDPRAAEKDRRFMVGLVGYPNVGKSSTINALFGAKKTAVAPTPGKTKHFQTLNVAPRLCICDCPGLVLPKYAKSKAEMVAAGVISIDRLTHIRLPIEEVCRRVGRLQLQDLYGIQLPPLPNSVPGAPPSAAQLLRTYALLRGWTAGSGLPDETRVGRHILKDYTNGRLLYIRLPPAEDTPKGMAAAGGWAPQCSAAKALALSGGGQQ